MISFFKYQDPLRFSMIFLILLLIRLPVLLNGYPLLIPELTWQIVGEKMSEGFVLYRDIWTTTEPLSAGMYYLIDVLFGKSQFMLQFFSLLLVFIQAVLFNFILSINNLYSDRTYVPALLYILFSSLFFDFYTLSPPLIGMTFVILAMHFVFFQIRTAEDDENLFYTGTLIAIAALFYFPYMVFIVLAIFSFLLFTGADLRKYLLLITGFVFPFIVTGVYFFLREGMDSFISSLSAALFSDTELLVSGKAFGVSLAIPIIILLGGIFMIVSASRYINYQYVAVRIFIFWMILSGITLYFTRTLSTFHLFVFVPVLAFFGAHFFLLIRNKWIRETSFAVCVIVILWINYGVLYQFAFTKNPVEFDQIVVKEPEAPYTFKDKKLLVLGNERSFYKENHLATPYLNWELSRKHFMNLDNYENASYVYENFIKDMPEIIIDQENLVPTLFQRLPKLAEQYRKEEGTNIYHRLERR